MFQELKELFSTLMNSQEIIRNGGLLLLILIVYAENGIIFGFFLPGDYLLFTAGLLCGTGDFPVNILLLMSGVWVAAVGGSYTGFFFGRYVGKAFYNRKDTWFFKREYIVRTRAVFIKFGGRTLILGRFLPIVRTFSPILAGIVEMDLRKFSYYNIIGGTIWVVGLISTGYFLGQRFPWLLNYLEYIVIGFFVVTGFVVIRQMFQGKKKEIKIQKA
ncbi:MAG: DedA family protein [Cytophagales bacterium]|nr:DedA family protein [Cytophagales bacterium]